MPPQSANHGRVVTTITLWFRGENRNYEGQGSINVLPAPPPNKGARKANICLYAAPWGTKVVLALLMAKDKSVAIRSLSRIF